MTQTTEEQIKILEKAIESLEGAHAAAQALLTELGDIEITDYGNDHSDDVESAEEDLINAITRLEGSVLREIESAMHPPRVMRDKLSRKEQ